MGIYHSTKYSKEWNPVVYVDFLVMSPAQVVFNLQKRQIATPSWYSSGTPRSLSFAATSCVRLMPVLFVPILCTSSFTICSMIADKQRRHHGSNKNCSLDI